MASGVEQISNFSAQDPRGKSDSTFSRLRTIKLPGSSQKAPEVVIALPTQPPTPNEETSSKRRLPRRFRRRSSKLSVSSDSTSNPTSPAALTSPPFSPRSETSDSASPRSPTSGEGRNRKSSTRVILRTLGRIFAAKPKSSSDSGNNEAPPTLVNQVNSFHSSNNNHPIADVSPSATQAEQQPFKRYPTSSDVMAKVLARSRESSRSAASSNAFLRHKDSSYDVEEGDYSSKSVDELKVLLDSCEDFEKRAKIRKQIRAIKKQTEETRGSSSVKSPATGDSPVARQRLAKDLLPKGSQQSSNKSSYRALSSVTSSASDPPKKSVSSTPSRFGTQERTPNSLTRSTPVSRLTRTELSSSLRNYRPSYKPPDHVVNRSESLRLSRPKDFIQSRQAPGQVRTVLRAHAVTPERVVLESVTSSDNVTVDPSSKDSTPARTASPVLKRSESCKENENDKTSGFIPVVPGNKRRSLGILGRVLSVKIDSSKSSTPPRGDIIEPPVVQSPPKTELRSVPEEKQAAPKSTKALVLGQKQEEKLRIVPVESKPAVQVTCSLSEVDGREIEISAANSPESEGESSANSYPEIRSVVELLVNHIAEENEAPTEEPITQVLTEEEESSLPEEPASISRESLNQEEVVADLKTELLSEEEKDQESEEAGSTEDNLPVESDSVESGEEKSSEVSEEKEKPSFYLSDEEEPSLKEESSLTDPLQPEEQKTLSSSAEDRVEEEVYLPKETAADSSTKDPSHQEEEEETIKRPTSLSIDTDSDSHTDSSDYSGAELEADDMSGRVAVRNRYGVNGGSVKSRIMATEQGTPTTDSAPKSRSVRPAVDARSFRNAEGVMSRINKFANNKDEPVKAVTSGAREERIRSRKSPTGTSFTSKDSTTHETSREVNNNSPKSPSFTTKFTGKSTAAAESKKSAMSKLEAASLSAIDDMRSMTRDTPTRRSRRANVETTESKVTTVHSGTVLQSTTVEVKFETVETVRKLRSPVTESTTKESSQVGAKVSSLMSSPRSSPSADQSRDCELAKVDVNSDDDDDVRSASAHSNDVDEANGEADQLDTDDVIQADSDDVTMPVVHDVAANAEESQNAETTTKQIIVEPPAASKEKEASELETRSERRERSDIRKEVATDSDSATTKQPVTVCDEAEAPSGRRRRRRKRYSDNSSVSDSTASTPESETAREGLGAEEKPVQAIAPKEDKADREDPASCDVADGPVTEESSVEKIAASRDTDNEVVADIKVEVIVDNSEDKETTNVAKDDKEAASESESNTVNDITTDGKSSGTVEKSDKSDETSNKTAESTDTMRYSLDNLSDITDIAVLEQLLDEAQEYEDRRCIRAALRELKKKHKAAGVDTSKDKSVSRWKTSRTTTPTANGRLQSSKLDRSTDVKTPTGLQRRVGTPLGCAKTTDSKSLSEKYSTGSSYSSKKKEMTSTGSKKIGSIFDRDEEEAPRKTGSRLDLERRQAERRRELTRNRSMPVSSSKDARKMFVAKLEGGSETKGKKVGRSPTFVVPNANNVKQMLLKWCQSKTRGYENVDINNFSGSWANGLGFCALVHNFFPDAFDFDELDPKNRAHNFELAFTTAEKLANADPLLDVEDMMIMGNRPDSKCVFTYVQSLYNKLRKFEKPLKPLSPIVKVMPGIKEVNSNSAPPAEGQVKWTV